MPNENFKSYGATLLIMAGVIFLGLTFHWKFATWQIVDWIFIIILLFIGYILYNYKK